MREDLIERLRSAAEAYPEDVFGKTTSGDRLQHGDVVQRAAATMGRHMAPMLREAAAALEAAREDACVALVADIRFACGDNGKRMQPELVEFIRGLAEDAARLDYIERTFSGMTNRERYLPVQMIWGKGCNGRTLREACDKYRKRDSAIDQARGKGVKDGT